MLETIFDFRYVIIMTNVKGGTFVLDIFKKCAE